MAAMEATSPLPATMDWQQFKPLFTLQPVKSTREKQLKLWSELVMRHCREHHLVTIHPSTFPLFRNDAIERQLSAEGIAAVVDHMIKIGCADWEDAGQKVLQILLKAPEVLANEIYQWATENGLLGSVSTIYELHSGEDTTTSFYGTDVSLIRKALGVLENTDRCRIIVGATAGD